MPLDPSIPLRAVSNRRNSLTDEYAAAVNIKNALAQQKAAEAELTRQENVRNALSGAINPQTGEMDWTKAVNTVATVDPMTALSLKGEMSKERAAGLDMEGKQLELASKRIDALNRILTSITDEQSYQSALRQAESLLGPDAVRGLPPNFDANAQAMVQQAKAQALDFKDRISLAMQDRTFQATEAERRRRAGMEAAEHYDKTGAWPPGYGPGAQPAGKMSGVIYDFDNLEGDPNDPNTPAGFRNFLEQAAPILGAQMGVDPDQIIAMSAIESGMNPQAVSPTGVGGPMQVTRDTAEGYGLNRDDPMQNTYAGAQTYADAFREFGDPALAAAAYNSGPESVRQAVQWSKDTGAPWQQSGYVRPEGVQHAKKFVEQIRVIRQMRDAQIAEVRDSDAPPAQKREMEQKIKSDAQKAEMELVTEQRDDKGLSLVTLKMPDRSFKTFPTTDREGITKALEAGAIEVPPATAAKGSAPNGGIPTQALKLQQEELDALSTASNTNADLGAIKAQVEGGNLDLGLWQNLESQARNFTGYSDENSRAFSSFKATLEKLRNDSLRLNKGVQTEGDAVRAWNELMASINDPEVVKQRLGEIMAINERAANIRKMNIDVIRQNYGADPLDYAPYMNPPAAVGNRDDNTPENAMPKPGDIQDGYRFKGGDPADPKAWERTQ